MLSRYQHLFFDFDGVLCNSAAVATHEYERLRRTRFPELPAMPDEASFDIVYAGPLKTALNKWLSQERTNEFFNCHSRAMEERTRDLRLFPGIAALLAHLPKASFSIVTSAYSTAVRKILIASGVYSTEGLYRILGREMSLPKDSKIKIALSELGLDSQRAVYVGDLESDLLYCRRIPMDMIAVGYGYQSPDYIRTVGSEYFAEDIDELATLLSSFGGPVPKVITLHEFD